MNRSQYNNNYSFYNNRLRCLQLLTNVTKDMVYLENSLFKENITQYEHNTITNQLKDLTFEYQKYCKDCDIFIKQ